MDIAPVTRFKFYVAVVSISTSNSLRNEGIILVQCYVVLTGPKNTSSILLIGDLDMELRKPNFRAAAMAPFTHLKSNHT
ncbi:hypothetical protein TNCV_2217691 [Trichonephila clavipes]|nr:hypothetical protein TNCV_2217691 [Trichonephila clavipes]